MKLSTHLHAIAAALTTSGLAAAGISLVQGNIYAAGASALVAAIGQGIEAAAHVYERSGNGT